MRGRLPLFSMPVPFPLRPQHELLGLFKGFAIRFFTIGRLFSLMADHINGISSTLVSGIPKGTVVHFTKHVFSQVPHLLGA